MVKELNYVCLKYGKITHLRLQVYMLKYYVYLHEVWYPITDYHVFILLVLTCRKTTASIYDVCVSLQYGWSDYVCACNALNK